MLSCQGHLDGATRPCMTATPPLWKIASLASWKKLPELQRNLRTDYATDVEAPDDPETATDTNGKKEMLAKDGAQNKNIMHR